MGSSLPSVTARIANRIWHRGQWSDFSTVVFPQDMRNCTTCHAKGATQADSWKTKPSRVVCGACHDDVNFGTRQNHVNLPQVEDNLC
jgi:OmcA/MtrC family decaheme c-type cytochrome